MDEKIQTENVIVFAVTLGVAVFGSVMFKKFLSVIPILIAVIAGYIAALCCGLVDFAEVQAAPVFALPNFSAPKFSIESDFDHSSGDSRDCIRAYWASDRNGKNHWKKLD